MQLSRDTLLFVCGYTYLGLCTLRAHTKEYTNKREREKRGEVQCNSQAVLDIREARILGRIDWEGGR